MRISVSLTMDKLRRKGRMDTLRLVLIFGMSLYGVLKSEIVHNRDKSKVIRRLAWPGGQTGRLDVIGQGTEDGNPGVHVADDDSYRCHHAN
jgi:hypothetical protein